MELLLGKVIDTEQLAKATRHGDAAGLTTADALVELGYASPLEVTEALAQWQGLPYADLAGCAVPAEALDLLPGCLAREHRVLPLGRVGGVVHVAIGDPEKLHSVADLACVVLNQQAQPVLAPRGQIIEAINSNYLDLLVGLAAGGCPREELVAAVERHFGVEDADSVDRPQGGPRHFRYEAMDTNGCEKKGVVKALNEEEAQQKVRQMGYFVTKIKVTRPPKTGWLF
jgi:hypothetical protein